MAPTQFKDAKEVKLSEYIETSCFRTVLFDDYLMPCGVSEVRVEIEMKREFVASLSFPVNFNNKIFGFVRMNDKLREYSPKDKPKQIKVIYINEWDESFAMVIELVDDKEVALFVSKEDVKNLLENCLRVPEQKSRK